jgi:heterodisulfide reductase subunit C/nitrate reductase gamma subunit
MIFDLALYGSLVIFALGTIYRMGCWFVRSVGPVSENWTPSARFFAALKGFLGLLPSKKTLTLLKVFFLDVMLQVRVLKEDGLRWGMHMLIYGGFMLLLLMHALDAWVSERLFSEYSPTLNPFMFLRDLFGAMVIAGLLIAIIRRIKMKPPRLYSSPMDVYAIVILAVIMISGILLEGLKITSHTVYEDMAYEYAGTEDEEELNALESYWVAHYSLVSPRLQGPFDSDTLSQGQEMHEGSCASCHSHPGWAFTGYAVARMIRPVAVKLDQAHGVDILRYMHFLACFIGLAYLPFSKMFHIIASPISLLANSVMDAHSHPANIITRQIMELDACTHCGSCTRRCSVQVAFQRIGNVAILPSEKIGIVREYVKGRPLDEGALHAMQEGAFVCTNCDRCTVVCPVGINLRELWTQVKEELIRKGHGVPWVLSQLSFYRGIEPRLKAGSDYGEPSMRVRKWISERCPEFSQPGKILSLGHGRKKGKEMPLFHPDAKTFAYCYTCENCTHVCPVVGNYENPLEVLGLLPHQIMRATGLGLKDFALGSSMLWDCTTCYQCQEHCPQGVKVTDVIYQLKNIALKDFYLA